MAIGSTASRAGQPSQIPKGKTTSPKLPTPLTHGSSLIANSIYLLSAGRPPPPSPSPRTLLTAALTNPQASESIRLRPSRLGCPQNVAPPPLCQSDLTAI